MIGQDLPFHSEEVDGRGLEQGGANGAVGVCNCEGHSAGGDEKAFSKLCSHLCLIGQCVPGMPITGKTVYHVSTANAGY